MKLPSPVAGRRQHKRLKGSWVEHEDSENSGFEPCLSSCPFIQISEAVFSERDGPGLRWV